MLAALIAAGSLAVEHAAAYQQEALPQRPLFRSEVSLVLHSVAVVDNDGNPVRGLTADEFRIAEDGEAQVITHFLAPDATPLDVALVLDASTSISHWARTVRESAKTFLGALDARDCVYLLPFNQQVGPGHWARALDPVLPRRIDGIFMDGGTALYDAVFDALATVDANSRGVVAKPEPQDLPAESGPPEVSGPAPGALTRAILQAETARLADVVVRSGSPVTGRSCGPELVDGVAGTPQRRRAIVLLTDGADKHSSRRFDEVLDLARDISIPVFPVVMGEARKDRQLQKVLAALAGNTGGSVLESDTAGGLAQAYDDLVVMLRASYLLGYRPEPGARAHWREIEVRSRRPSYRLVHRAGYFR